MNFGKFVLLVQCQLSALADYVLIDDPVTTTNLHQSMVTPYDPVSLVDRRFDRVILSENYTLTLWVQFKELPWATCELTIFTFEGGSIKYINLYYKSDYILMRSASTTSISDNQLDLSGGIVQWTWHFIAATITGQQQTLSVGFFNDRILVNQEQTSVVTLNPVDYSVSMLPSIQIGMGAAAAAVYSEAYAAVYDFRVYNRSLNQQELNDIITARGCHNSCSTCWGPAMEAWNGYHWIVPPYEELQTVKPTTKYINIDDPIWQNKYGDHTANQAWTGWVKEVAAFNPINDADWFELFQVRVNSWAWTRDYLIDSGQVWVISRVSIRNQFTATATTNPLGYPDVQDAIYLEFANANTGGVGEYYWTSTKQTIPRTAPNEWMWIGASFCQDKLTVWIVLESYAPNIVWDEHTLPTGVDPPLIWPGSDLGAGEGEGEGEQTEMQIGDSDSNGGQYILRSVRYHFDTWLTTASLTDEFAADQLNWMKGWANCESESICTSCESGWSFDSQPTPQCQPCHRACEQCLNEGDTNCIACQSGYFLQSSLTIWHNECATGFTKNTSTNTWDGTAGLIFEMQFDQLTQIFYDSISQITGQYGTTQNIDDSDPIPLHERGIYFDGLDDQVQIGLRFGSPSTALHFHLEFSMLLWIRVYWCQPGTATFLSKKNTNNDIFLQLNIRNDGTLSNFYLESELAGNTGEVQKVENYANYSTWFTIGFTVQFDTAIPGMKMKLMMNTYTSQFTASATDLFNQYITDASENFLDLGTGYSEVGTGRQTTYYYGQIYNMIIFNEYRDILTEYSNYYTNCPSSWFPCLDSQECIPTCEKDQYPTQGTWGSWLSSWTLGCVNGDSCERWADLYCAVCSSFHTQSCTQCINNTFVLSNGQCEWPVNSSLDLTLLLCCAYKLEEDSTSCLNECPIGYLTNTFNQKCQKWADNCQTCVSVTTCITCLYSSYMTPSGVCESQCPALYYANSDTRSWQTCSAECETCITRDACVTCIHGFVRTDLAAQESLCVCDETAINTSTQSQLLCLRENLAEYSSEEQIDKLQDAQQTTEMTFEDLEEIIEIASLISIESVDQSSDIITIINESAQKSIKGETGEIHITSENVQGTFVRDYVDEFQSQWVLVESGSGVRVPEILDFSAVDVDLAQINVVQISKPDTQNSVQNTKFPILSVEIWAVRGYSRSGTVVFQNLAQNFTIIFDDISLNTQLQYECVYLISGSQWSTDGCWLVENTASFAKCTCNHLSQFTVQASETDSNIATTGDFSSTENFDLSTNYAPIILLSVIYTIYLAGLLVLTRLDKKYYKKNNANIENFKVISTTMIDSEPPSNSPWDISQDSIENALNEAIKTHKYVETQSFDPVVFTQVNKRPNTARSKKLQREEFLIITQIDNGSITFREPSAEQSKEEPQPMPAKSVEDETEQEEEQKRPRKSFIDRFLNRQLLLGIIFRGQPNITRCERWHIVLCIIMLAIFSIGLFYDADRDPQKEEEENDKTIDESFEEFGWKDFWIAFYTLLITFPVPFTLKRMFRRSPIKKDSSMDGIAKQLKYMKIKRIAAYGTVFIVVAWCSWTIVAFSLSFGFNTTQAWMINFGFTTAFDILVKDSISASVLSIFFMVLPRIKCCKKDEDEDEHDGILAGEVDI